MTERITKMKSISDEGSLKKKMSKEKNNNLSNKKLQGLTNKSNE